MKCVVKNCGNSSKNYPRGVSFHRFPSVTRQADQWTQILGLRINHRKRKDRICSKHFLKGDFEEKPYPDKTKRFLKPCALPLPPMEDPQQVHESSLNYKPLVDDKGKVAAVENVEVKKEPAEDDYGLTTDSTAKMKKYKRKTERANISEENMLAAIRDIEKKKMTVKEASRHYGILKPTLYTRLKRLKAEAGSLDHQEITLKMGLKIQDKCSKHASNQVFTTEDENFLVNYLLTCSEIDFGLTMEETRRLAYQFAVHLNRKFPESWTKNQKAGKEWALGFLKRHMEVSLRKSENTPANVPRSASPPSLRQFINDTGTPPDFSGEQALDLSMRSRDFYSENEVQVIVPKRTYPYLRREPLDLSMAAMTSLALSASPPVPYAQRQFGGLDILRPIPNLHTDSGVSRGMSSAIVTKSPECDVKKELPPLEDPQQVHESSSKPDGGRVTGMETIQVKEEPIEDNCEMTTDLESIIEVVKEEITEESTDSYYKIYEM